MDAPKKVFGVLFMAALVLVALAAMLFIKQLRAELPPTTEFDEPVKDFPYKWVMNYADDMQYPELPTGCEATAAATLARMNGAFLTKTQVADALPKSDDDFVHAFIGDPYTPYGWTISARGMTETLNMIFQSREEYAAVEFTGTPIHELPMPCAVWISIDLKDNGEAVRESEGYGLFRNPHCVVLITSNDEYVTVVDPLVGLTHYERWRFTQVYNHMGRQAVYIGTLDRALKLMRERNIGVYQ